MFEQHVYQRRRAALRARTGSGVLLFLGNEASPINFSHNVYPFRQDSSFSYFFGLRMPRLAAIIDVDSGEEVLFGDEITPDDELWLGRQERLAQQAARVAIATVRPYADLEKVVLAARERKRALHFLPPCQAGTLLSLGQLVNLPVPELRQASSSALIRAVVALREIKDAGEIAQVESALAMTNSMHRAAMRMSRPGMWEREVVAEMRRLLACQGLQESYAPVFTKRKEGLHVQTYDLQLEAGDLVINDAGAASSLDYASDVTRTWPVDGRYSEAQREIYELLLQAQLAGIEAMRPGLRYLDLHLQVSVAIARGMVDLGFFRGDPQEIVAAGAHALCFPHGLGHQLGLDVHDMESFGEDWVGYDQSVTRRQQFGLSNLRLAKPLRAGMVVTIEPGIYFTPGLIDRWQAEGRHAEYIRYDRMQAYRGFGGMRIEDVVHVDVTGARVLGPPIPKTVDEVEAAMA